MLLLIIEDGRLGYVSEEVAHEHVGRLRAAVPCRRSLRNQRVMLVIFSRRRRRHCVYASRHCWHLLEWDCRVVQQSAVCLSSLLSAGLVVRMLGELLLVLLILLYVF